VLIGTGWRGGVVLAVFFCASSGVSRILPASGEAGDAKGDRRDAWQVLANGSIAAAAALLGLREPGLGLWLLSVSLAAAAADTWATAVGTWSGRTPRDLWTGRVVPPGTSGGVTLPGSFGAMGGGTVVATTYALVADAPALLPALALLGVLGMAADSLLGAVVQGRFRCPACQRPSERTVHQCGTPTILEKGWRWFSNDLVNFCAIGFAASVGWAVWLW
jgi:uncharacterized protein (TIGR00297 family)